MKTIVMSILAALFLYSIGLNVSNFLKVNSSKANTQQSKVEQSIISGNSEEASEVLAESLEEIKDILKQQEARQAVTEDTLYDLMVIISEKQNKEYSLSTKVKDSAVQMMEQMPEDEFNSVETTVEHHISSGHWSVENAMEFMQNSSDMSHEQRTQIQLKIVQAINAGVLQPESVEHPLF